MMKLTFVLSLAFTAAAFASPAKPPQYFCVARLFCPESVDANVQELPGDRDMDIHAPTLNEAREGCLHSYSDAYRLLQKRAPAGCLIQSEAFQAVRARR